MASFMVYVT